MATITAPAGTRFTSFRWAGTARRRDCRYALQLYADAPDIQPIAIKNVRANQRCPRARRAQAAGYRSRTFNVSGATRIVQRVICVGGDGRKSCSARGSQLHPHLRGRGRDRRRPRADARRSSATRRSARGEWVSGTQPLNYDASDNVGVRTAHAVVSRSDRRYRSSARARSPRPTAPSPTASRARTVPGRSSVDTTRFPEGTQALVVQAQDTAGNIGSSAAVTARIDNTPPPASTSASRAARQWRNSNDFAVAWTNPPEDDRAPIVAAGYKLCAGRRRTLHSRASRPAPASRASAFRSRRRASGPCRCGDATPPATRPRPRRRCRSRCATTPSRRSSASSLAVAADPTLAAVQVTDNVSGLADGSIEISREGSGIWQALATQKDGEPAGRPDRRRRAARRELRAARDALATRRTTRPRPTGGSTASRWRSRCRCGSSRRCRPAFEHDRIVRRTIRRHGKRRRVRRRVTVLRAGGARPIRPAGAGHRPAHQPRRPGDRRRGGPGALALQRSAPSSSSPCCRPTATAATATRPPAARTARCGSPTPARR